jgi:hypothetical protein
VRRRPAADVAGEGLGADDTDGVLREMNLSLFVFAVAATQLGMQSVVR